MEAYERALLAFPCERIVVVTTKKLESIIRHLVSIPEKNLIVQPSNADTTAAIALTALHLEICFPDCVAVLLFTDHKITGLKNFIQTIKHVSKLAKSLNTILAIGTEPTGPETQYGYIKLGAKTALTKVYSVAAFTEKPDRETAEKFVASGEYLWNTGVYVWQTSVLLDQIKLHASDIYQKLLELRIVAATDEFHSLVHKWYQEVSKISFEKKITEKLKDLLVYKANYTWQDIGNWNSFYETCPHDKNGNATIYTSSDQVVDYVNSTGCLVLPYQSRVALLGVRDLVVVQTHDTIFVGERKVAEQVKNIPK